MKWRFSPLPDPLLPRAADGPTPEQIQALADMDGASRARRLLIKHRYWQEIDPLALPWPIMRLWVTEPDEMWGGFLIVAAATEGDAVELAGGAHVSPYRGPIENLSHQQIEDIRRWETP